MPCSERLTHVLPNLRAMRPLFFDLNTIGLQIMANLQGTPEREQFGAFLRTINEMRAAINENIEWLEHGCPDAGG